MTWAFVTANMTLGGGDQVLLAYARALQGTSHRIVLFSLEPVVDRQCLAGQVRAAGVEIRRLPSGIRLLLAAIMVPLLLPLALAAWGLTAVRRVRAARAQDPHVRRTTPAAAACWVYSRLHGCFVVREVRRFLRDSGPGTGLQIFHAAACQASGRLLAAATGPTVYTEITSPASYGVWIPDIAPLLPLFTRVVVPAPIIGALMEERVGRKLPLGVIPFPVLAEERLLQLGPLPGRSRYGMIGRLSAEKNHLGLLDAAVRTRRACPAARLCIAGSGPLQELLQQRVRELGEELFVEIRAFDKVEEVLAQLDIVVLFSATEGMPLVVLEAMAAGRPVVATPVGAIPEMLVNGKTGFLVPVSDSAALAAQVLALLQDPAKAQRMGAAGRARFQQHFAGKHIAQLTRTLYDSLVPVAKEQAPNRAT
jgi:glycosyltransferase involved in cell wall biosynthesis